MPKEETTHEDVSAQDQEGLNQPGSEQTQDEPAVGNDPVSRREAKMAAVHQKRIEEREHERKQAALVDDPDLTEEEYELRRQAASQDQLPVTGDEDGEQETEASAGEETPSAEETDLTPLGFEKNEEGEFIKKMKINGEIVDVTVEEYDRMAQRNVAADRAFQENAARASDLDQREMAIRQKEQELEQQQTPPARQPGDDVVDIEASLDSAITAIYDGNTDAARESLRSALEQGRQTTTPNMDELVTEATTRIEQNQEVDRRNESAREGWNELVEKNPEFKTDVALQAMADVYLKEEMESNPDASPKDHIIKAGERALERVSGQPGQGNEGDPPPVPQTTNAEREDRKANLVRLPGGNARAEIDSNEDSTDYSDSAKIQRMRATRHIGRG